MSGNLNASIAQSLVAEIVSSYLKNNQIAPADIPTLINSVYQSLVTADKSPSSGPDRAPAVPIRQSVRPQYVVCLDCGWRGQMLRRHIKAGHGLTPEQYRARWGLKSDHPLTAPAYSQTRSTMAKQLGLGKKAKGRGRRKRAAA